MLNSNKAPVINLNIDPPAQIVIMEKKTDLPLKLAKPAQRALANAGITSLKQLSKFSEQEIAALHGIGNDALLKLKQALSEKGLSFVTE